MSDDASNTATAVAEAPPTAADAGADPVTPSKTFTQADLDRIVSDRVAREKAKYADHGDLKRQATEAAKRAEQLQAELEQFRQASMSEQEKALAKAVKEAETRARTETLGTVGQRLVRAEFKAQAAGNIPDLDGVLDDLNLAKFIGQDGEPDTAAIASAVKRLTPPPPPEQPEAPLVAPGPRPDLTQGTRQNLPLNGDPILAAVKEKLGLR